MESRRKIRHMLSQRQLIWYAGAFDALSAKLIEQAGFDAVFTTGFGVSAALLGQPDLELYTLTENVNVVRNIVKAVDVPVGADCDTGYGNAINVMRTVREFEDAGASVIILEDQLSPKRCPVVFSKIEIVDIDEGVAKIKAAVEARRDPDLVIVARTDAATVEEAIVRAKAYAAAGADLVKGIGRTFRKADDLRRLHQETGVPLHLTVLGPLEDIPLEELREMGGIAGFPLIGLTSAAQAMRANLEALQRSKSTKDLPMPRMEEKELTAILGMKRLTELQMKYLPEGRAG